MSEDKGIINLHKITTNVYVAVIFSLAQLGASITFLSVFFNHFFISTDYFRLIAIALPIGIATTTGFGLAFTVLDEIFGNENIHDIIMKVTFSAGVATLLLEAISIVGVLEGKRTAKWGITLYIYYGLGYTLTIIIGIAWASYRRKAKFKKQG